MTTESAERQAPNADPAELAKFSALAHRWWDPESEFRPLHQINPLRLAWIETMTGGIAGAVELDDDATDVTVTILDAGGATLKTMNLGQTAKGTTEFDWDGTTDGGQPAGNGPFKVVATATNGGKAVTTRPLVWAPVTAVTDISSGSPKLNVAGLGAIDIAAVRQVG